MPHIDATLAWDDTTSWIVHKASRNRATAHGAPTVLLLAYDTLRTRDVHVCNVSRQDGSVCRLPVNHDGLHVPFSGELIATTGVHVVAVVEA